MAVNPYPGGWFTATGSSAPVVAPPPPSPASVAPVNTNASLAAAQAAQQAAQYNQYVSTLQATIDQANAEGAQWRKTQFEAQLKEAEKARQNAVQIAQLQAETSRYGTNVQRETELARLKQQQRQFDATHGLEMQRLGLDRAKTWTEYSRTYDDLFALQELRGAVASTAAGGGPAPIAQAGRPQAKSYGDFYALSTYGQPPGGQPAQGAGGGQDARLKAMRAISDAMPPSETPGNDAQDWAAIDAITSLYFAGRPGDVQRLGAERQKAAQGALARAGYNPALVDEEYRRGLPGQQNPRAA